MLRLGILDRDDVKKACPEIDTVQSLTDTASRTVREHEPNLEPAAHGTAVHWEVKNAIENATKEAKKKKSHEPYPLVAEISYRKTIEETGEPPPREPPHYGEKGTIRVDVLEKRDDGTVCVYDIKTLRQRLYQPRMHEIAAAVTKHFGPGHRIIVIEIRPMQ